MRYLFEDYAFDIERRELHRGSDAVSLAPQVFDLLDYLIRNRERVVSKQDLINAVWNGRIVSDAALTTRLNALRSAIGDSGETQRVIKTLPRKGFRFVAAVREVQRPNDAASADDTAEPPPTLPDKPSIAVLPFANLSSDPEQEYFADGMVEEITMALSRFKSLFVIARNSSFAYKGKAVDIKQVGRELGVRYVLEGSVRKAAGRVRIAGQLIDAANGAHLWADRFEGDLNDIFTLQDEVTVNVVAAIQPKLLHAEIELAVRRPNDLSAYDLYLRAIPHTYSMTREATAEALQLISRALDIDPRYGAAASLACFCHTVNIVQAWSADPMSEIREVVRLSELVLSSDENDPDALAGVGWAKGYFSRDFANAIEMVDRAVALNPNSATAWNYRGMVYQFAGQPEEVIRSFAFSARLNPLDPMVFATSAVTAGALISLGRFDEAAALARKALSKNENFAPSYRCLAAALAHLGQDEEARNTVARLLRIDPGFRISEWIARGGRWPQIYIEGLRKAGFPE